jgi:hypothetical protein
MCYARSIEEIIQAATLTTADRLKEIANKRIKYNKRVEHRGKLNKKK